MAGGADAHDGDWRAPVTLEGHHVRLEPLAEQHLEGLVAVGLEPDIWTWMPRPVASREDMREFLEEALLAAAEGRQVPFAILERRAGRVAGSTRLLNIEPAHRRLEIGYTWLAPAWQRTAVNGEAKLLLLRHAFETLGANRVEFKTDSRNAASRRALLGIGATEEGILRSHMVTHAPGLRDSAYYSVIAEEWPAVRAQLEQRLSRHAA